MMLVSILFACTSSNLSPNQGNLPDRITIGTTSKIRTLDPADNSEFFPSNILYNTTERLYTYKLGTTELVPQLAADFPKVSDDGLVYTIPVRTGIKFHDRTDFDARAMAFSLRRFMRLQGAPSYVLSDVIEKIAAPTPTELIITLKQPLQFFPKLLAFTGASAISPTVYKHITGFEPNKLIGTGPYQLTQYNEGSVLHLDTFPDYWGKKPENKGIDIQFFSSGANLFNSFKTGGVDVAFQTLSPNQIRNLEVNAAKQGWTVASGQGGTILYMALNVQQPPLTDVRVRQAIAAAIDRPLLQERVFQNQRSSLYSLLPNTLADYKPTFQKLYGDGNGDLAKKLLTEAGYSEQNPARITLWYPPQYAGNGDLVVSTLKATMEKAVGKILQIKTERVENTVGYGFLEQGAYPAYLLDWVPDFFDPDNYIKPFLDCEETKDNFCTKGSTKTQGSFYNSPEMNKLIVQERQERDPNKRSLLLTQIQELLAKDVPLIPLWQNKEYAFARPNLSGVTVEPTQQLLYWTIKRAK
ncbi:ABC transporter substrate-binding protein [Tumidithrix helvetica PCC 7403]|uniref:ABC transporter substrate-binding protein n=1 Tax=Tumidithrix helvetica TaxID=3457545 RepID=UPI003CB4C212